MGKLILPKKIPKQMGNCFFPLISPVLGRFEGHHFQAAALRFDGLPHEVRVRLGVHVEPALAVRCKLIHQLCWKVATDQHVTRECWQAHGEVLGSTDLNIN